MPRQSVHEGKNILQQAEQFGKAPVTEKSRVYGLAVFWLVVAAIGSIAFFWKGFEALLSAWTRPEYSYGPLVPIITGYMTLREIKRHPITVFDDSRIPGILVLIFGMLIGLLGNLSEIPDFVSYGFIVSVGGLVLVMAGKQGFRFWPGWLHLFFMIPLPSILYWRVSTTLQYISSHLGVAFIKLAGVPVLLDGNVIDLGQYQLLVAEACNGLRYLFPLLSFGWLFAVLYEGRRWHRVVLFVSTVPITILMNSFRIGVIGVLVNYFGIKQAEGFLHLFEGWIIFVACIILLYVEAWVLNRFFSGGERKPNILDLDVQKVAAPLRALAGLKAIRPLVMASVLLLAVGSIWQGIPSFTSASVDRASFAYFPDQVGPWTGAPQVLDTAIENVLKADDYYLSDYAAQGKNVNLFMTFYQKQTGGSGIHSPEVCIPGGGWEVSNWAARTVDLGAELGSIPVNRAVIQKNLNRQLVYYWFEQRGRRMTSDYQAKLYSIFDQVTQGRSDGGLVRLVTPIAKGEDIGAADARLKSFMKDLAQKLPDYFPPRDSKGR